jgi:DNA (cytosine-5)-methyltransferase 1
VTDRPRLLDLFCGAGGAAMGYHRAGFDVVGVDLAHQPRFPFEFHQADALTFPLDGFDAIHASPPCQAWSTMRRGLWKDREHPELIEPIRARLLAAGVPYVIENVANARRLLVNPVFLCGTMFGLGTSDGNQLRRHRYFECSFGLALAPPCVHNGYSAGPVYGGGQNGDYHTPRRKPKTVGVWGHAGGSSNRDNVAQFDTAARREAMGIDWMTGKELSESIPPAYTEWIGRALLAALAS